MVTTSTLHSSASLATATDSQILHSVRTTLRFAYGLVPIVAGADKFTNVLTHWEQYLNPAMTRLLPLSPAGFMHVVGIIEIVAGLLVLARPRLGGFVVMAWLLAIAAQLLVGWNFVDVAVRDVVMSLGALTLARLTPIVERRENSVHP